MGGGGVRIVAQRLLEVCRGFRVRLAPGQQLRQVGVGLGEVGLQANRLAELLLRRREVAGGQTGEAEGVVGLRQIRIDRQGSP